MQAAREIIMRSMLLKWDEIEEALDLDGTAPAPRLPEPPAGAPHSGLHANSTGFPGSSCR
jgi:hypothetical protein